MRVKVYSSPIIQPQQQEKAMQNGDRIFLFQRRAATRLKRHGQEGNGACFLPLVVRNEISTILHSVLAGRTCPSDQDQVTDSVYVIQYIINDHP